MSAIDVQWYSHHHKLAFHIIISIIKYQVYIALISNKCSEALNSATQIIIYKHSILITSVITMKP